MRLYEPSVQLPCCYVNIYLIVAFEPLKICILLKCCDAIVDLFE